jgi:serine/threonine protein kinase
MRKLVHFLYALVHPGVLRTHGLYETMLGGRSLCAVVTESSPGRPLSEVLASSALSEKQAAAVFHGVLLPLVFLHEKRIISLSISTKTFSYYRSPEGAVVKMRDFRKAMNLLERVSIDRTSVDFPGYIAPHREDGRQYSEQIDLYCAGVLLYELVTRALPEYTRGGGGELIEAAFVPELLADVTPSCVDLLTSLCVDDPDGRLLGKHALLHPFFSTHAVSLPCQTAIRKRLQPPRLHSESSITSEHGSSSSKDGSLEDAIEDSIFNAHDDIESFAYWNEAPSQRSDSQ